MLGPDFFLRSSRDTWLAVVGKVPYLRCVSRVPGARITGFFLTTKLPVAWDREIRSGVMWSWLSSVRLRQADADLSIRDHNLLTKSTLGVRQRRRDISVLWEIASGSFNRTSARINLLICVAGRAAPAKTKGKFSTSGTHRVAWMHVTGPSKGGYAQSSPLETRCHQSVALPDTVWVWNITHRKK